MRDRKLDHRFCNQRLNVSVTQNLTQYKKNRNFLLKNFVEGVDKSCRLDYYKCNITKMAVKRRVGLRIDPYQKARAMEKGRKQEAENGLGAVRARCMSAKFATGCARYSVRL